QAALLQLQQNLGNAHVQRLVQRSLARRQGTAPPALGLGSEHAVQREDAPALPGPGPTTTASSQLIVDDTAPDVPAGQLTKSAFLAQVRTAVDTAVGQALAGSPWAAMARPKIDEQIDHQFATYADQDGPTL